MDKIKPAGEVADQASMGERTLGRFAIGLGSTALLFVCGVLAAFAGATTCHEDLQSADQAPHLCATAGSGISLSISAVAGPAIILLLLVVSATRRTIGYVTASFLVGEAVLLLMWTLVSDGTIHY